MRYFLFLICMYLGATITMYAQSLEQLGSDIEGSEAGDRLGFTTNLNSDGTIVVVGVPRNNTNADNSGKVTVYQLINGDWQQLGQSIFGDAEGDEFGLSVDINADGTKIIVGAPNNDTNGLSSGQVKTFEYNNESDNWELTGTLLGSSTNHSLGIAVSMSDDGSRIAIGAFTGVVPGGASLPVSPGYAAIYEYSSNEWNLISYLSGKSDYEGFGFSVSLSGDGSRLAVGAPGFLGGPPLNTPGRVETFEYYNNNWISLGDINKNFTGLSTIDIGDQLGNSVNLSSDGNHLAIGVPGYGNDPLLGMVIVYIWENNQWNLQGDSIQAQSNNENFGHSIAVSNDGFKIIVGTLNGLAKSYEFASDTWTQVDTDIMPEGSGESGVSVAISAGGGIISIGSYTHDGSSGTDSGQVRLFKKTNDANLIDIITTNFSDIDANSATLGGIIILDGSETVTERGVIYTTNTGNGTEILDFVINDQGVIKQPSTALTNTFSDTINNLIEFTTYNYRAYVIDNAGNISYGDVLHFTTSLLGTSLIPFVELGSKISGLADNGYNRVVTVNADGTVKAVGIGNDDTNGENSGQVQIFKLVNGEWQQKGQSINGEAAGNKFGSSLDLNADGTRLIVGVPYRNGNTGKVAIYDYDKNRDTWELSKNILGKLANDHFGFSVSISDVGSRVAIGAPTDPGSHTNPAGTVYLYEYINDDWSLVKTMIGEYGNEAYGYNVNLSGDGNRLAIGAPNIQFSGASAIENIPGRIEVFEYSSVNDDWEELEENFVGLPSLSSGDNFGYSVSLNTDGSVLATCSTNVNGSSSGMVIIFNYSNNSWNIVGNPIYGQSGLGYIDIGIDVSISGNGKKVAVGGYNPLIVYELISSSWMAIDATNIPEGIEEDSRYVSISQGGGIISVAYPSHNAVHSYKITSNGIHIITTYPSEIQSNTVTLGGIIIPVGSETITERGIIYTTKTAAFPSFLDFVIGDEDVTKNISLQTSSDFFNTITGLLENTTYSFRAYATDDQGTTKYGDILRFTTAELSQLVFTLRVFLQGPYDSVSGLMNDDLRVAGVIPTTSPYSDALVANSAVFDVAGNDAIVDWVYVELRDKNDITNVLAGTSALLQRDGDVVAIDGTSPVSFNESSDDYYISISHRNHIAIATDMVVSLSNIVTNIDFTNSNNIRGGVVGISEVEGGVYAMLGGDVDGNGQVLPSDRAAISLSLGLIGYNINDVNMDGNVLPIDRGALVIDLLGKTIQF